MKALILALTLVASMAHADIWNKGVTFTTNTSGGITENAAYLVGLDSSTNAYRTVQVDSNGQIKTTGGGGAISVTNTILVTSAFSPMGMTNYSALSYSATSVNLTTTAASAVPCLVCLSSNGGAAAGFKVQFTSSATAPVALTSSSQGHYIAASASAQCWGPFVSGTHLHAAGVAATSSILVDVQKAQ